MDNVPIILSDVVPPKSLEKTLEIIERVKNSGEDIEGTLKWFDEQNFAEWEEFFTCECVQKFLKIRR